MYQQVMFEIAMLNKDIIEIEWKAQGLSGLFRIVDVLDDYIVIQAGKHTEEVRYMPDSMTTKDNTVAYNRYEGIRFEVHRVSGTVEVGIGNKRGDSLMIGI